MAISSLDLLRCKVCMFRGSIGTPVQVLPDKHTPEQAGGDWFASVLCDDCLVVLKTRHSPFITEGQIAMSEGDFTAMKAAKFFERSLNQLKYGGVE